MKIETLEFGKAVFLANAKGDELDFMRSALYPLPGAESDEVKSAVLHAILASKAYRYEEYDHRIAYYFGSSKSTTVVLEVSRDLRLLDWPRWTRQTSIQDAFNIHQSKLFVRSEQGNFIDSEDNTKTWRNFYPLHTVSVRGVDYHVAMIDTCLGEHVYKVIIEKPTPAGY